MSVIDVLVLRVLARRVDAMTYVIKNALRLDFLAPFETRVVLRSARRLQKLGLVKEVPSHPYVIMKCWCISDAGRTALADLDRAAAATDGGER